MSFRLGPDGKPVEIESSFAQKKTAASAADGGTMPPKGHVGVTSSNPAEGRTQPPAVDLFNHMSGAPLAGGMRPSKMAVTPEPPTRPMSMQGETPAQPAATPQASAAMVPEEPKTSVNFGSAGAGSETFVCGWFVVVDGPGKGKSLIVGAGQSAISRSLSERIPLNFGDISITSKQQLLVIYDDENREFIIAPGNGSSLNRLNGQVVAGQMQLNSGDVLKVGATTLRFVAFCDQSFSWG